MLKRTSERKKKGFRRMATAMMTAFVLVCLTVMNSMASETDLEKYRMPNLDGSTGTLTVTMKYTDPNIESDTENQKVMPGVVVKLAKIANLAVNGGSADYTLLEAYEGAAAVEDISLAGMTVEQSNTLAQVLEPIVSADEKAAGVQEQTTNEEGKAVFSNLEPGMYLVYQDKEANTAHRVDSIATFLISVPYPVVSDGDSVETTENAWNYNVEVTPKTELDGPKNNGVIHITKELFNADDQLPFYPPENEELIFYVGLFNDEACTDQVEGTTDQPLRFYNSRTATATFENLTTDKTYYIAETDGKGNAEKTAIRGKGIIFYPTYPDGQQVSITRFEPETDYAFQNVTYGLPDEYYYGGTLSITKKTKQGTEDYDTNDVFYAGIFNDANFTSLNQVVKLDMNGGNTVTVPFETYIGLKKDDTVTYYVTETDENGTPLNEAEQQFQISVDKTDGKVVLTTSASDDTVVITNDFGAPDDDQAYNEENTTTKETTDSSDTTNTRTTTKTKKTGDQNPIALYLGILVAAVVIAGIILIRKKKDNKHSA